MDLPEVIKARRSIRRYKPTPIAEDVLRKILGAARLAPSANNAQPWKFIVVRDEDMKLKLTGACNNKKWMAEAPVIVVACGFPDEADSYMGGYMNSFSVDVAIALDHMILSATNEGLGTCWIGRFKEEKVKDLLKIPSDVKVLALIPLGYSNEEPESAGRKNLSEIICYDKFS
ncbi:MAG: nitroreductase family protein [Thermoplasmata archaeon]|nr:MAG: nitroreductase family protein [Thermoplasmata archaeon]